VKGFWGDNVYVIFDVQWQRRMLIATLANQADDLENVWLIFLIFFIFIS
jgi:hypothetical protein